MAGASESRVRTNPQEAGRPLVAQGWGATRRGRRRAGPPSVAHPSTTAAGQARPFRLPRIWILPVCALLCVCTTPSRAQTQFLTRPTDQISAPDSTTAASDLRLRSARATFMGFLDAVNDVARGNESRIDDAVACLDLGGIPASIRSERGPQLAVELKDVVDRTRYVVAEEIPDDPNGPPYVFVRRAEGEIVLAPNARGEWTFTRGTVGSIPELLRATKGKSRVEGVLRSPLDIAPGLWVRSKIPDSLRTERLWLEDWQWIGLFLLIFLGILLDRIVAGVVLANLKRFLERQRVTIAEKFLEDGLRPLGLLVMAVVWLLGLRYLALPDQLFAILLLATKLVAAVAGLWAAFRAIDVVAEYLMKRAQQTASKLDDVLIPMFRKAIKIFLTVIGALFIADSLDLNITAFLAGLGLGGLALALAAKDTVENLFGSLTVLLDRPFNVGDWIRIGDQEGTVTEVGFRSTRIRTFYDSIITVPNSRLINTAVDNMGGRRYRRWSTTLGLQLRHTAGDDRSFLRGRSRARPAAPLHPEGLLPRLRERVRFQLARRTPLRVPRGTRLADGAARAASPFPRYPPVGPTPRSPVRVPDPDPPHVPGTAARGSGRRPAAEFRGRGRGAFPRARTRSLDRPRAPRRGSAQAPARLRPLTRGPTPPRPIQGWQCRALPDPHRPAWAREAGRPAACCLQDHRAVRASCPEWNGVRLRRSSPEGAPAQFAPPAKPGPTRSSGRPTAEVEWAAGKRYGACFLPSRRHEGVRTDHGHGGRIDEEAITPWHSGVRCRSGIAAVRRRLQLRGRRRDSATDSDGVG